MARYRKYLIAAWLLAVMLMSSAPSNAAGPILTWLGFGDDPPNTYCPGYYLAPTMTKLCDDVHGPRVGVYAPDRHPELPPTYNDLRFLISPAPPATTLVPVPIPPATSKAQ